MDPFGDKRDREEEMKDRQADDLNYGTPFRSMWETLTTGSRRRTEINKIVLTTIRIYVRRVRTDHNGLCLWNQEQSYPTFSL